MKSCRLFMTGLGAVMFVLGIIMGVTNYLWKSDARATMADIRAGRDTEKRKYWMIEQSFFNLYNYWGESDNVIIHC